MSRPIDLMGSVRQWLRKPVFNTQHYKVHIKGKVEQSRERSCALPYILA